MARGGGIEYDMVEIPPSFRQKLRELIEGGDLGGAGTRELLAHEVHLLSRSLRAHLFNDTGTVVLRRGFRIDVQDHQARNPWHRNRMVAQRNAEHFIKVRRRVGTDQ